MTSSRMGQRADMHCGRRRNVGSAARTLSGALGAWLGFAGSIALVGGLLTGDHAIAVAAMPAVLVGMVVEAAGWGGRRGAIRRRGLERYAD